jgi:predicted site-specific integrase-resolvase
VNLTEWAHAQGIHVQTAYRWYREATLPVPVPKVGRLILVSPETATEAARNTEGAALSAHDRRLVVLDDSEVTDDLVRDMAEVLTWFYARLYGRWSARNRALKALGCAQQDIGPKAVKLQTSGGAM